jgi:hypothetical protein
MTEYMPQGGNDETHIIDVHVRSELASRVGDAGRLPAQEQSTTLEQKPKHVRYTVTDLGVGGSYSEAFFLNDERDIQDTL